MDRRGDVLAHGHRGKQRSSELRIFLNYRREETSGHAGRLYDELVLRFGEDHIFMDVDTIQPGVDFTEAVKDPVGTCDAFVAVIGRQWLHVTDTRGRRRLDNPEDFVRLEIEAALDRNIRLIPALVQDSEMPRSDELPEPLASLARRNALKLSDDRWRYDVGRLVTALERVAQEKGERSRTPAPAKPPPAPSPEPRPAPQRAGLPKRALLGAAAAAIVLVAGGIVLVNSLTGSPKPAPASPRPAAIHVPKLVGASQAAAVSALRRLGLRNRVVRVRGSGRVGRVLKQLPAAGLQVTKGYTVHLTVLAGPKRVAVRRLVDGTQRAAQARLRALGLRPKTRFVYHASKKGTVVKQAPRRETQVVKASAVQLTISKGPYVAPPPPTSRTSR
jgi:hypothetical protein